MCRCCVVSSSVLSRGLTCYASRGVSSGVVLCQPMLCATFHGVMPCVTVLRVMRHAVLYMCCVKRCYVESSCVMLCVTRCATW